MVARLAFVREIEHMCKVVSQKRAIETLLELVRLGELSPYLSAQLVIANNRKTEDRTLSERTLLRWIVAFREHGEAGLIPAVRQKEMGVPVWFAAFRKHYANPNNPSVAYCYGKFKEEYDGVCPSIEQVRRFLDKLSPEAREQGRKSPQALKALQPFKRRDASMLWPNDVWIPDGHKFDAEVIDPISGQPFRPEITMVIDWATRRIVGYGVSLAESAFSTIDAFKEAVTRCGMYNILYSDNGSGFVNETVKEINNRLGGTHTTSLPYNSQARGIIERPHKTILVPLAQTYPSYIGALVDKEAATKRHRISRKQLAAGFKPINIPSFEQFLYDLEHALNDYNTRPHSGLPRIRDAETNCLRHLSPLEAWKQAIAEGWEPLKAPANVVEALMRPQVGRKTHRGEVRWNNGIYFLDALRDFHGEDIRISYDIRDPSKILVWTLEGAQIGEATLGGNSQPAMPLSMVDKAQETREKGQLSRIVKKAKTITGKDVELRVLSQDSNFEFSSQQRLIAQETAKQITAEQSAPPAWAPPKKPLSKYRAWEQLDARVQAGEVLSDAEKDWWGRYPHLPEFAIAKETLEFKPNDKRDARKATA